MKIYGGELIPSGSTITLPVTALATTGSNTFNGNQTVNGEVTITGNLTAQQYIVSSSVMYLTESFSSGSHKFGDTIDDVHTVTGSLNVTGSQTINGTLGVSIGGITELNVQQAGVTLGNVVTDTHRVTGSLNVSGSQTINGTLGVSIGGVSELSVQQSGVILGNLITDTHRVTGSFNVSGSITTTSSVTAQGVNVGANALGTDRMFQVSGTAFTSGTSQFGIVNNPTMGTPTTIYGYYGGVNVTSATNAYGIYITGAGGTITNKFGVYQEGSGDKNYFAGSVGIGTTSPNTKLHIEGSATNGTIGTEAILTLGRALSSGTSFQNAASFNLGRYNTTGGVYESYTRLDIALKGNGASSNYTTDVNVMTLQNNGYVGIGTTSPGRLLEIRSGGTSTTPTVYFGGGPTAAFVGGEVGLALSSNIVAATGSPGSSQTALGGVGFTYVSSTRPTEFNIGISGAPTVSSNVIFWNETERMRIQSRALLINRTSQNNPAGTSYLEVGGSEANNGLVRIVNSVNQGDVNHGSLMIVNTASYAVGNDASIGFALSNSANSNYDPRASIGCKTTSNLGGDLVFNTRNDSNYAERVRITSTGIVQPAANGTQDLGTASLRWATIYTSDLSLSNGIGDYTIVEGEEKLYLYNNKNNKVYSFVLHEEDPATATPKKS